METIDQEAARFVNQISDLENFRSRYYEINPEDNNFTVIYPGMEIYSIEKNLYILLAESTKESFKPSWTYRPDYASYDLYGSVIYWPILLYINNISNFEEFTSLDYILVPPAKTILKIIQDKVDQEDLINANPDSELTGYDLFYKDPLDRNELNKLKAKENIYENEEDVESISTNDSTTIELVERVDVITLTSSDISNQYIDLTQLPLNKSNISLYLEDFNIEQRYGYDYVLKKNDLEEYKRIGWNSSECYGNMGLSFILSSGMKLRVVYLYESIRLI